MSMLFCFKGISSFDKLEAVQGDGRNLAPAGSIPNAVAIQAALVMNGLISYGIKMEIFIDLPIVGKISIPIEATGMVPVRLPFMNMNADIGADGEEKEEEVYN